MAFTGGAYYTLGDPYLFATAAAVAVGGASILGGSGHYLGTVAGALTLTLMVSLLTLLNVGQAWLNIAYGLISSEPSCSRRRGLRGVRDTEKRKKGRGR